MGKAADQLDPRDAVEEDAYARDLDTQPVGLTGAGAYPAGLATGQPYSEGNPEFYSEELATGATYSDLDNDTDTPPEEDDEEIQKSKAQIEDTRSQLSSTIDAIQEKLSPENLAQQAKDTVREATIGKAQDMVSNATDTAKEAVSNAGDTAMEAVSNAGDTVKGMGSGIFETIRQNPVPAALAGLGLGWLYLSNRKSSSSYSNAGGSRYGQGYTSKGYYDAGYAPGADYQTGYDSSQRTDYQTPYGGGQRSDYPTGYGSQQGYGGSGDQRSGIGGAVGQVQDKVSDVAGQATDKVGDVAGQVQDTVGNVAGQVQDQAGQLAHQAQYGAQRAQSGLQQMLQSTPLAVGAIALATGLAVGLSIPETDKENQLMGEQRDQLMNQAQHTVTEKAQAVQAVAQQAVGAAKDAAKDAAGEQGLTS